jgi:MFS family permease
MQNDRSLDPAAHSHSKWLALAAALLGWMFDGLEMGLFPLVAKPALGELLPGETDTVVVAWLAIITAIFLIGAATGGVLFGWLGDRIGRVRAMTLSILTYALFSGACGLANQAWQVAALRFAASMGMGGEWSLGVALVMEVWPNRSRAWLAGLIGAVANFGYMLIAVAGMGLNEIIGELGQFLLNIGLSTEMKDHFVGNSGWRLLMLFGAFPAVLTLLIQFFVPESHRWAEEKKGGSISHWQTRDLFGVLIGAAAACGMIALLATDQIDWRWRLGGCLASFFVVLGGYLYPIVRYMQRQSLASFRGEQGDTVGLAAQKSEDAQVLRRMLLGAALSGVALLGTWGTMQQSPFWAA